MDKRISKRAASGGARSPGPLKIESAEMASDVHDFADEEKAGHLFAFQCFAGEFTGVYAARGYFRFFVAFRTRWGERPFMDVVLEFVERWIGPGLRGVQFKPARGETIRQDSL